MEPMGTEAWAQCAIVGDGSKPGAGIALTGADLGFRV